MKKIPSPYNTEPRKASLKFELPSNFIKGKPIHMEEDNTGDFPSSYVDYICPFYLNCQNRNCMLIEKECSERNCPIKLEPTEYDKAKMKNEKIIIRRLSFMLNSIFRESQVNAMHKNMQERLNFSICDLKHLRKIQRTLAKAILDYLGFSLALALVSAITEPKSDEDEISTILDISKVRQSQLENKAFRMLAVPNIVDILTDIGYRNFKGLDEKGNKIEEPVVSFNQIDHKPKDDEEPIEDTEE